MSECASRAARQVAPDGGAWPALSPRYKRRKDKRRPGLPMLKDDAPMLGDGLHYQVPPGVGVLYLGTSVRYGAAQHFGHGASCPATAGPVRGGRRRAGDHCRGSRARGWGG
ncbi:phage virion morphogenesis protein [Thermomonas sp. S9]|nr:phage virion morphogenesis protein [Thermomonas sp. S9]